MKQNSEKPTTKICKHCRSEIDIKAKRCPHCRKKQKHTGLIVLLVIVIIIILLVVIGSLGGNSTAPEPEEVVYIDDADIDKIYGDTDAYKGKYVKLTGQIFNIEKNEDGLFLQINEDIENYENNTLIEYTGDISSLDIDYDDYVLVDGYISGSTTYKNIVGGTMEAPTIVAKSITKLSYIEAVVPTLKSIEVNQTVEHNGYKLTLTKVEFAEKETRCYFTFENSGKSEFTLWSGESKLIQGSSQYETTYNYEEEYEELPYDISQNVVASGIVTFDGIDQNTDFTITMTGYNTSSYDEYEFTYDVSM